MENLQLFLVVVCLQEEFSLQLKKCAILAAAKLLKLIPTSLKLITPSTSLFLRLLGVLLNKFQWDCNFHGCLQPNV